LALLIDSIALSVISWLLSLVLVPLVGAADSTNSNLFALVVGGVGLVLFIILAFLQLFYFGYMWSRSGQTLGMKVTNIRVARRDGAKLGFWRAALRGTIGYWVSSLIFGLGFLWAAFDSQKEAWHDKLFDTAVFPA
jgi:uncharacterized RDD family membrane protein YckC